MSITYIIPNDGASLASCALRDNLNADGWVFLFQNNHTITDFDTYASFVPATFSGYATQPVTCSITGISSTGIGTISCASVTFASNGGTIPNTIYGAAVASVIDGNTLIAAAANTASGGVPLANNGDNITQQLTVTVQSLSR